MKYEAINSTQTPLRPQELHGYTSDWYQAETASNMFELRVSLVLSCRLSIFIEKNILKKKSYIFNKDISNSKTTQTNTCRTDIHTTFTVSDEYQSYIDTTRLAIGDVEQFE